MAALSATPTAASQAPAAPSPSDSVPAETPTAEPAPSESPSVADSEPIVDDVERGSVTVKTDSYFLFPSPLGQFTDEDFTDGGPQYSIDYDKSMLIAGEDITDFPKRLGPDELPADGAPSGVMWKTKGKVGTTNITYWYINPASPDVQINGVYTVNIVN